MTDLTSLTLAQARDGLRARDFTAIELTDAYLAAIEAGAPLNAFIKVTADVAREQ
ncbi:MAG: Asp-tRNA(Asn)/Glu-tRNA(Gln) amidotransferase subunit GatA, partial [Hyphomicrobiales bacterium]